MILLYPQLSSHDALSAQRLELLGVSASTVRLSVGIEDAADLSPTSKAALSHA